MPLGLVIAGSFDIFLDGLLIGVAFLAGKAIGLVVTIALTACSFFVAFSIFSILKVRVTSSLQRYVWLAIVTVTMPFGAFIGSTIVNQLPVSYIVSVLAFGIAALLYLGIEELLVEAHQMDDTLWRTSFFFIGFLAILLLRILG